MMRPTINVVSDCLRKKKFAAAKTKELREGDRPIGVVGMGR